MEDIKSLETYDPSSEQTERLLDDWRIACAWWSQILAKREFTYSREQVINVASLIYNELKKRGIQFHPETMKPAAKKLYEIVSKGKLEAEDDNRDLAEIVRSGEEMGEVIKLDDILPYFKDAYLTKPYIYLVGGLCNHPKDGTTGDIDILIREKKPRGNERMPLVFRLYRMFPHKLWDRIQILWSNEDFGPFTNYVPIYDQLIERREDSTELVLMSEGAEAEFGNYPQLERDAVVPDEVVIDTLRSSEAHVREMAKESKERGVKPMRFFEMLKGIAGYRKMEKFTPEGVLAVTKPDDYPYEVDEKFDGMRVQIHKKGHKVKIFSLDGNNITSKLDFMATEARKTYRDNDVVLDAEVTGWTKGWRKGEHIGRSDVAGYLHAARLPHNNFYANIFDVLYLDGKDIHNQPLAERRATLEKLPSSEHLRVIEVRIAKNKDELVKAIKWASDFPGSEGAMIKSLKSTYPLGGMTSKWIKFKVEADIDAEVLDVHQVAGSKSWNYLCIIRNGRGDPIPVGRTYNTNIQAKRGDIIRVAFGNLNEYTDPKTEQVWFNWVFPRVIEKREDKKKPDTDLTARNLVEETHGEKGQKSFPRRYKELLDAADLEQWLEDYPNVELHQLSAIYNLSEDEVSDLYLAAPTGLHYDRAWQQDEPVFDANPFLTPGDEDKHWGFVLHNHFRGKSLHGDLRLERPSFLVGWTLNYQKEGKPDKDIDTMEEAGTFASNTGNIKHFKQGEKGAQQIVVEKKAPEPLPWLKYHGVMKPGEVGSTKEHEGVFDIVANGEVEFGTQKPYYHEYWLHPKSGAYKDLMKGRFVVRLLKNVWGGKAGRGKFVWMAWFTKDQEPYILSKRAVDLGVMPPDGLSWLPRQMRSRIPKELRFWKLKGKAATKARDELSELYRKGKLNLDRDDIPDSGKLTLSKICWRGPIVVRYGCSRDEYHLFLDGEGISKPIDIILDGDPIELGKVSAVIAEPIDRKWMSFEGELPNESRLNPDKKTKADMKILERGHYKAERDGDRIVLEVKSGAMKGKWLLTRTRPKTSLWVFKKEG